MSSHHHSGYLAVSSQLITASSDPISDDRHCRAVSSLAERWQISSLAVMRRTCLAARARQREIKIRAHLPPRRSRAERVLWPPSRAPTLSATRKEASLLPREHLRLQPPPPLPRPPPHPPHPHRACLQVPKARRAGRGDTVQRAHHRQPLQLPFRRHPDRGRVKRKVSRERPHHPPLPPRARCARRQSRTRSHETPTAGGTARRRGRMARRARAVRMRAAP